MPGARSAILMASGPFLTLLSSHWTSRDDRFTAAKLLALGLGFSGVAALLGPAALNGGAGLAGQLAVIAAAWCYALAAVLSRRLDELSALTNSAMVLATATAYLLPPALFAQSPPAPAAPAALGRWSFSGWRRPPWPGCCGFS